jgi:glycosyltransferase involved in cell wall biosynthesis
VSAVTSTASPLRIAHLTATFPPYLGGAGTTAFQLATGLADRGHHVEVFTADAQGDAPDAGRAVVHRLRPTFAVGNAPLIPALSRVRGFDVVHLHHPFIFGAELTLLARLRAQGTALVVSYHNRLIGEGLRRPLFWIYEETWGRLTTQAADRICVVSQRHAGTVSYLRAVRRRRPERLEVLPNGVDVRAFSPGPADGRLRETHGIAPEAVVAVFVAALDRAHFFKRLDLVLEALALVAEPRLHVLVVGGGEWLDRYRAQAAGAGLGERVHFLGRVDHERLPSVLRAADFLLLTSDLESFGMVLLEAMACGLPVLATDPPGVRAVVDEGRTGFLAPRGDAAAIAGRVRDMLALDAQERKRMGLAGRAECEERYAWPLLVPRLEEIYVRALASRRGGDT